MVIILVRHRHPIQIDTSLLKLQDVFIYQMFISFHSFNFSKDSKSKLKNKQIKLKNKYFNFIKINRLQLIAIVHKLVNLLAITIQSIHFITGTINHKGS